MGKSFEFNPASTNKIEKSTNVENNPEQDTERIEPFELEFYITDHSADNADTGSPEKLRSLYEDIKKDGVTSVRYDWRWKNIESKPGRYDESHLERYKQAKDIMAEVGMSEPTIILSDIPDWAKELYKNDKEKFFDAFKNYTGQVKERLASSEGKKISRIQILNELNNKVFTPVAAEDLPRFCQITREVFQDYNPDIKLMGTLLASNLNAKLGLGTEIGKYLEEFEKVKDNFDVIAVDYYPGLWHLPINEAGLMPKKEWFRQMGPLKEVFERIANWDVKYELGEVGFPTNQTFGNEKKQRYFYDTFFRAFKHMLLDLRKKGVKLPSSVGLYEAVDEAPKNLSGKIGRKTINPEHDFGMRTSEGERKMILQGSPHSSPENQPTGKSQLKNIIRYLRSPMSKKEE